jgi:UDP-glucose 4-epimerase
LRPPPDDTPARWGGSKGEGNGYGTALMRVVVTGATGNIGTTLLPALAAHPDVGDIVGIARRPPGWAVPKVHWYAAAVERDDLAEVFRGADAVVHLVWIIQPSRDVERQRVVNIVGTQRVLAAAAAAGVRAVVHVSSVGAYSPAPRDHEVDESWPTDGMAGLAYSWQKAYAERLLDAFEREWPDIRVVRIRPALVMQRAAGGEVKRYFLGGLLPSALIRPQLVLSVLRRGPLQVQAVHATDVGRAIALATVSDASGAFNVAAPEVIGVDRPVATRVVHRLAAASYAAHLQPTSGGWVEAAGHLPLMDTSRIRHELGWSATWSAEDAVADLLRGIHERAQGPTPALT